jgi:hypothetical protein
MITAANVSPVCKHQTEQGLRSLHEAGSACPAAAGPRRTPRRRGAQLILRVRGAPTTDVPDGTLPLNQTSAAGSPRLSIRARRSGGLAFGKPSPGANRGLAVDWNYDRIVGRSRPMDRMIDDRIVTRSRPVHRPIDHRPVILVRVSAGRIAAHKQQGCGRKHREEGRRRLHGHCQTPVDLAQKGRLGLELKSRVHMIPARGTSRHSSSPRSSIRRFDAHARSN